MTSTQGPGERGPGWWQASDGNWYPPDGEPHGPGWWQASDGKWYPPTPTPGSPPTPGWAPPAPQIVAPATGNGLAITALVLGIVGLVLCWVPFLGVLLGVLAVIFGIIGARRARVSGARRGQARAGWIMGIVTILLGVVLTAVIINATNHLAKARIERAVKDYYTNVLHDPPRSVSCPRDLDKKVGASEACTVTTADGTTETATFTVTSLTGDTFFFHIVVS